MTAVEPPFATAPTLRKATLEDLEGLLGLEEAAFETDRLSRRSFRRFLTSESDHLMVAEMPVAGLTGYILLLKHRGTRLARLYSICVDAAARGRGIAEQLILAGEEAVRRDGCAYVRLEVRRDNPGAIALYRKLGYRLFDTYDNYYEDGEQALRFEKRIRFYAGPRADLFVPYYSQTTPFTCGPACVMMAMKALGNDVPLEQREELRIWREATTIYMASGHGGCGPRGLALAAHRRGVDVQIFLNDDGVLFLDSVRGEQKKQVLSVVQADYQSQVETAGIAVHYRPLSLADLQDALAKHLVPVVLISSWRLTREKAPHWVVVAAIDDDFVYIHDPEIHWDRDETDADKQNVPIDRAAFAGMARFGQWATRAALLLGKRRTRRRGRNG